MEKQTDKWSATENQRVRLLLRNNCAALHARPVNRITVEEFADVLKPIWTGPGHSQGSRLRGVLERIFNAAKVTDNPAEWAKLKEDHLSADAIEGEHHPSLPYTQLPDFMREIAAKQFCRRGRFNSSF